MGFNLDENNKIKYKILKNTVVNELSLNIYELEHNITKAKVVLFENDDENRVFNICFKTPVNNSKGTPHILEHSVLCGSKKYNVKDPFIELAKSSMNTFLNAMTYPDKTCYPVASANLKDFYNLMDVYLDSVFFPNIYTNKNIFMQEGWHYEVEDEKLKVNGVVLNEMRGVYSDKNEVLSDFIFKTLYNNTNYQYAYGGDPKEIINLSYDEFLSFHKKFYSPTNAIIFLYGKLDFNERLSYLDKEYLSKFKYDKNYLVQFKDYYKLNENLFDNNKLSYEKDYYNVDTEEDNKDTSILSYNFIIKNKKNDLDSILIRILDYILFNQEGAIIKDELINNKIGQSIQTIYETGLYEPLYCIEAHNIDENKKDLFVNYINSLFNYILENGIDKEKFEAGVNTIYYECLEQDNSQSKGLNYILTSLDSYLYGEDINIFLNYKEAFEKIKKFDLNDRDCYVYQLIKQIFIDNKYKNLVCLSPKLNILTEYNNELNNILDNRKQNISSVEFENIKKESIKLKQYQESSNDDLSVLPKLLVSDIDRDKNLIDYDLEDIKGKKILITNKKINDLVYLGININIDDLSDFEIYILSFLCKIITRLDTKNYDYKKLNNIIDLKTGMFNLNPVSYDDNLYLRLNIKTLVSNLDDVFEILYEVIFNTIFDNKKKILDILNELKTVSLSSIIQTGHIVSYHRSMYNISKNARNLDRVSSNGIAHNLFLDEFLSKYNDYIDAFINDLKYISKKVFNIEKFNFDVCIDNIIIDKFNNSVSVFIDKINNTVDASFYKFNDFMNINKFDKNDKSEAILINSDVNFVARSGLFKKDSYTGVMNMLATLLDYDYLWNNIRVLGGAYGCMAHFLRTGVGVFATYRDPNLIKSDECFKNIVNFIESINDNNIDIEKLIVSTIAKIDNPFNSYNFHERNVSYYVRNLDNNYINNFRHQILNTTLDDIKKLYDQMVDVINTNETCALVCEKSFEEAKKYYSNIIKLNLT